MKSSIKILVTFLLALLVTGSGTPGQAKTSGATPEPTYLIFQLGTENPNFEKLVPEVKAEFGAQPAGSPRYIGFAVALLTFKPPIEELRAKVTRALDTAEQSGLPVFLTLDDMNYMPEYSDPSMVEWTAFPKPGETYGPRAKYYWLNWGSWQALPPTPNFESPKIRQEISTRLKEGVLPPVLERLARWKKQKRQYLFAGFCVGWETGIPDYRGFRQAGILPRDKRQQITMTTEEQGEQFGYAALYTRGWTQQKIEEQARQSGKSVEDATTELLFQVIHDYTAFWAKTLNDAGIAKERIYTHGVSWESLPNPEQHSRAPWGAKSSRIPPVWVTVNPYSRPGYTVGSGMFEPKGLVRLIRAAGATDGWGGVEAYMRGVETETAFGGYLRKLFDNGADLVDIWGWTAPGTYYYPKNAPGALRAAHSWLDGKELPLTADTSAPPPGMPPSLQEKMHRLGGLTRRRSLEGADIQPVSDLMRDVRALIEQQKFSEAEALVDRALKLLGDSPAPQAPAPAQQPGAASGGIPPSLQTKMAHLQALADKRQQEGFDMEPVVAVAEAIEPLMQQQKFSEAEAQVDRALKLLGDSPTPEAPAPQSQSGATPGGVPASLQAKIHRLHSLADRRKQEGVDLHPVQELLQGLHPLMEQQKFTEAEALVDRALKLLGDSPTPETPAPAQQPAATSGGVPPSLRAKMSHLQALAQQRKQEGFDMGPVVAVAEGIHPLMEQQKFTEAEAQVDRALKLLGDSPTPQAPPAPVSNQEPQASTPAGAKPLPCPAARAPIDLASGNWALHGDCTVNGISLRGDAQLWVEGLAFTVYGDINLEQNAGLHIRGGSFNVANQFKHQYQITVKGNALLDLRDLRMLTNAGVAACLSSIYQGSDDSLFHIENVQIESAHNWILCHVRDRARLEIKNSPHFPNEIYPNANSTVRIEGPGAGQRVWLHFSPGSTVVLDNMPTTHTYTFSFGRNTPGVTGIGYQVDVVEGSAEFGIDSVPRSNVTIRNSRVGASYAFSDVTTPETLTGLKGGRQTGTYRNQGRVFALENAELPPYGWQIYNANGGIPLAKVVPVTITDSLVNELGATKQGRFEAAHVQFAFAVLAAIGPSSMVHVRDSVINSQTIQGDSDGVVKIEDSEIFGSAVQATANSRIFILNTALSRNERNPKCVPLLPPREGIPLDRCNPVNPSLEIQFVVRGQGAIWVAGIDPIAQVIRSGSPYIFVGNAILKTADDKPYTYNLSYRQKSASAFMAITTGATGPKQAQPLGQLDTTGLAPGDYIVQLELVAPGEEPIAVQRPFTIAGP